MLEFFLRSIEGVGRRVKFISFEALVGKPDLKGLVIFLETFRLADAPGKLAPYIYTSGTFSLSVCDEAASVVTARFKGERETLDLSGKTRAGLKALVSIMRWIRE